MKKKRIREELYNIAERLDAIDKKLVLNPQAVDQVLGYGQVSVDTQHVLVNSLPKNMKLYKKHNSLIAFWGIPWDSGYVLEIATSKMHHTLDVMRV